MAVRGRAGSAVSIHLVPWLLIALFFICTAAKKEPCDTCRRLVDRFHEGLEKTSKKNFGGGNTAWEEKTLSKYESSEIRLVEIIELLCDSTDFECNLMVEEHEEQIEKWWFKMRNKSPDLLKWFCIGTINVCCPSGTYGPDCLACLGGSEQPCHGNGFCSGDGTRGGDGTCSCKAEYMGPFCLECADGYYNSERNDTHSVCSACHEACKTCHEATNKDCKECKDGWREEDEICIDQDECAAETSPCKESQYCLNTEGSYLCNKCDESCSGCTGEGPEKCTECSDGYVLEDNKCTDINECESDEKICVGENEDCINIPGAYKCVCAEGFEEQDGQCVALKKTDEEIITQQNVASDAAQESINIHEDL
ncbi:protein disulfide isomerase CRELD2 [Rana temporaria]|uniref:protein disulfide isomerase CRELD2 n=1 Tax=Rana temporaria TaxID=8407 RepID=UPI001AADF43A|nr:protein disulfide isomerase CRELD2 [Rana temporaria]